ncbi:MAG: helix-turn-helix domain-containing protein [Leptonema sp. (in: bacteria)]
MKHATTKKTQNSKEKQKEIAKKNTNPPSNPKNLFAEARIKKGLSLLKIAKDTNLDRKILYKIEKGDFDNMKLGHLITLSNYLGVNLFQFLREQYKLDDMDYYSEEIGNLVDRVVWLQMDLIYSELKELAKLTKMRIDDFNVQEIISKRENLTKLIVLNTRLKKNEIDPSDALKHFPVVNQGYLRRKNLEKELKNK